MTTDRGGAGSPDGQAAATSSAAGGGQTKTEASGGGGGTITVTVAPFTGGPFVVTVGRRDTVDDLKKAVAKKLKVLKDRICLLYRERFVRSFEQKKPPICVSEPVLQITEIFKRKTGPKNLFRPTGFLTAKPEWGQQKKWANKFIKLQSSAYVMLYLSSVMLRYILVLLIICMLL